MLIGDASLRDRTVELLLERGADPGARDAHGLSALEYACWRGALGGVKRLLARLPAAACGTPDAFGMTPLFKCVGFAQHECAACLLASGKVDVNQRQVEFRNLLFKKFQFLYCIFVAMPRFVLKL